MVPSGHYAGMARTSDVVNHVIVVFDRSGSMSEHFSEVQGPTRPRGISASSAVKIDEAREQLISWLATSDYTKATVVPFSDRADEPFTAALPSDLPRITSYIRAIGAGGNTNMAEALRLAFGIGAPEHQREASTVRYLIVTDGLSQTQAEDLQLVSTLLPFSQGIDGVLIDPTLAGEGHLRRLCVRGRFLPVYGSESLRSSLAEQEALQARRAPMLRAYNNLREEAQVNLNRLEQVTGQGVSESMRAKAGDLLSALVKALNEFARFREELADPETSELALHEYLDRLAELSAKADALSSLTSNFRISLGYPQALAIGYTTTFLVQIYPPQLRRPAVQRLRKTFGEIEHSEVTADSSLDTGMTVELELSSPAVEFASPKHIVLSPAGAHGAFWAKARDSATPGKHSGTLTIRDVATKIEFESVPFEMNIVDYAFDHVSRPRLAQLLTVSTAVVALSAFVYSMVTQTHQVVGAVTGAVGGVISGFIAARMAGLYVRRTVTVANASDEGGSAPML